MSAAQRKSMLTGRHALHLLALAVAAVLSGPVLAADADPDPDPNAESPKTLPGPPTSVVVEGTLPFIPTANTILTRLPLALRLTPMNVGTVNQALLEDQDAYILGDALRNVSGVNVQTVFNATDLFFIRGFDSLTSSMVLTDGAPEPEVTFYQMYNVDRVEVLKGPGGFLYGRNAQTGALSGLVNIVRKQPVPGTFGRVGASYGTFQTEDATLDYNTSWGEDKYLFRMNSAWRQSELYRDEKETRNSAINPAFTWRIGKNSSLNVNLERVDSDYEPDSGLPLVDGRIADVPRTRSYQSPFDTSDQQLSRAQIDFETKLSERWSLRNKTYARQLNWNSDGTFLTGVFPSFVTGRPEVNRTIALLDDKQRFVGNQFEAVLTAATGPVKHKILTGLDLARFGDDSEFDVAFLPGIDLEDPVETASKPLTSIPLQARASDNRTLVVAPYAIDQVTFSDRFHALAGVRVDTYDFEDRAVGSSQDDTILSPMLGVVFSPTKNVSLYANAGRSSGPPPSRVPNDPDPETGAQVEVGAKMDCLDGKLQATVAAYHLRRENIGIPDDNGFTQQDGDQRSRGIEVEIAAEPRPRLRAFLSYAYDDAELTRFTERVVVGVDPNTFQPIFATLDRSDNVPAFVPDHILNVWVSQRFENGFGFAGGGRYVSDQFIAEDNAYEIDGYLTFDAAVYYNVKGWDLSLNFKNLTNREYETRGFGSTAVIPAMPFAVYGGVQYGF